MLDHFKTFTWKGDERNNFILKDITTSIKIYQEELKGRYSWIPYYMKDDDTLELISYKFYGNVDYWWIIMITNNIVDYSEDLPKNGETFIEYCCNKHNIPYDPNGVDHLVALSKPMFYEKNGIITHVGDINDFSIIKPKGKNKKNNLPREDKCSIDIDGGEDDRQYINVEALGKPVTILDYETRVNDKKRNIRILNKQYINDLINDLSGVLNE